MSNITNNDELYMKKALLQAKAAGRRDEVPVGAVIVRDGVIIARGKNTRENACDPCGHAELNALRSAARKLKGWNLHDCELYVTLEPCPMCAGACVNARIKRVVYGASDPKAGACGSTCNVFGISALNHHPQAQGGVLQDQCAGLLSAFFAAKRKKAFDKAYKS